MLWVLSGTGRKPKAEDIVHVGNKQWAQAPDQRAMKREEVPTEERKEKHKRFASATNAGQGLSLILIQFNRY